MRSHIIQSFKHSPVNSPKNNAQLHIIASIVEKNDKQINQMMAEMRLSGHYGKI